MGLKKILIFSLLVFLFKLSFVNTFASGKIPEKPNIVLILADDMGWGDIRSNGNLVIETPVLDKLAEKSLSFDRFYVCPL